MAASLSLAGTLASNTNSNNNNNNNNNNENNNNDINVNIGNNNNNANSNNAIMFLPMVGRGLALERRGAAGQRHPFHDPAYIQELCGQISAGEHNFGNFI